MSIKARANQWSAVHQRIGGPTPLPLRGPPETLAAALAPLALSPLLSLALPEAKTLMPQMVNSQRQHMGGPTYDTSSATRHVIHAYVRTYV